MRDKTGGRRKGTPNKVTSDLRKELKNILSAEIERIPELLDQIEGAEKKLNLLIKLMPFVFPKIQPICQTEGEPIVMDFSTCSGY